MHQATHPAQATLVTPSDRYQTARRLGDLALSTFLVLLAASRGFALVEGAREGDLVAGIHQAVAGLGLLIMAGLVLMRRPAIATRPGLMPKLIALVGSWMSIPLVLLPLTWRPDWLLIGSTGIMLISDFFVVWALLTLRYSFSVFPEARRLIRHGPYQMVRHPLYAAYIVTYISLALTRLSVLALLFAAIGIAGEVLRARQEERVLRATFPEYASYAKNTPAFFPRPTGVGVSRL
ncbi:MAG: isoprenylcysteine carboxylmethyltransferase family protein [Chloroflexota bacterium]|nr:isoprenylcysteine carboxylmethyltransferase family protein [Chloroflexota bacterium]